MFAFGRTLFLTAALWHPLPAEPACDDPVQAAGSALLQSRRKSSLASYPLANLYPDAGLPEINKSLAPHCRPGASFAPPAVAQKIQGQILSSRAATFRTRDAACSGITLVHFEVNSSSTSCCPVDSLSCGGCAKFASGKCEKCLGGYDLKDGKCLACIGIPGWTNELGQTCDAINAAGCNDKPVHGKTSNQACCLCGGGKKSPTPFSYPDQRFAVGSAVDLKPVPRTASRYSLNSDCGFAAHNLTMDGATGAIHYLSSSSKPDKAFSVQCEVTAHQAVGLVETVKVTVSADIMTYGANVLIFSPSVQSFSPTTLAPLKDYSMVCAPEAPWLSLSSAGRLSFISGRSGGAVTEAETPDAELVSLDGAVCAVSANVQVGDSVLKQSSTFAIVKPKPWQELSYDSNYLEVVVGEDVPGMKPKVPVGFEEAVGGLRPTSWHVTCTVQDELQGSVEGPYWSYDSLWGVGMLGSHEILEVQPDGTISISVGENMAKVFDEQSADSQQRKSLLLDCGVWGSFPGSDFPAVQVPLMIRVKDSMCWVRQSFMGTVVAELSITTEPLCRNNCRMSKKCSHFTYYEDKCKHYRVDSEGGTTVTALAKVTGCTDLGTCLRLKHSDWVMAGDYCPVAFEEVASGTESLAVSALDAVALTGQFAKQGGYVNQTGNPCYDSGDEKCGRLEFKLKCSKETKVKFGADILAPDSHQDSFWLQMSGGGRSAWHTGAYRSWGWSLDSPEATAPAGESRVSFWGREPIRVRGFQLRQGGAHCQFLVPPRSSRAVMYRKESPIPQEVMYLGMAAQGSGCPFGAWRLVRSSTADYVDEKMGYFDLRGTEMLCLGPGLPTSDGPAALDYATLACGRPLFEEVEEQLQPLVFDDPSTEQPADFWLHPCDCLPLPWGSAWPADSLALENIPPGSNGSFIPPPFLIVSGQFACPSRQLLPGAAGIQFQSEAESMERSDCEERCKDFEGCQFYWTGSSHGAQTCRLYSGCDSLVREFGMEGDLMALPHNVSCQVANPEGCWKTSLRKQFLTQKQGTSPSFTRGAVVINQGGTRSWTGNSTGSKNRDFTYIEPFGELSTIKLLGWSYMQRNAGFIRDLPGIATAVVQGLNPNKNYKYSIKQITPTPTQNNKVTVNHGSQQTMSQYSRRRNNYNREGTVASTPRGELVLDFEAINYPLNAGTRTSGHSSSTASDSCRRRYRITSCDCFAESGICTGSKVHNDVCYAYGTRDVSGSTMKNVKVRAKTRCMEMRWNKAYSVATSGGASFSFLQNGVNESLDEGDREMSLDSVSAARDEDDDLDEENLAEENAEEEQEEDKESEADEQSEDSQDEDDDQEGLDSLDDESEDHEKEVQMKVHEHSISLVEEGESSQSGSEGWRRRRRRRRRRRTRRRRSRRRRSRRRRSRRRRTLPSSVSASCPSGRQVLSCNCFPDTFSEKAGQWTITHHCKEVWMSGRTCYAKGGFAQAICGEIPEPAARSWNTREASGRYWTNKDEGPAASCNGGRVLTGCWCSSTTGRGDNCAKVWADGNTCRARASGDRAHASQQTIKVTARCAVLATAVLVLSELKIELAATSLMETPVLETKRKRGQLAPLSFHYMHLHQQCDALLLMGGIGVEHCSRPNYRIPNYNPWENKKVMPKSFIHGSEVTVSCWKERFESFRANVKTRKETLHCVNGDWFNSLNTKELGHFSCEPCVVVGGDGYAKYDKRNEQELYFFSRLAMRVYTELGSVVETSAAAHKFCLTKDPTRSGGMTLVNQQECPEILAIQLAGNSEIEERTMKLLNEGAPDNNQCLEAVPAGDGVSASVAHKACNKEVVEQTISPMALPSIMWNMHKDADRTSGEDLHSAFSSYCGAHSALASLSFGQIFGGVTTGVKSRCHFAPVIKFGQFVDSAITYDKTSSNWPDWYTILADTPILCADGEALTGFKHQPASNKFRYECSRIGGLGAKYEWFSSQVEVKAFDANRANFIESLMMITVDCGTNGLLSGFHFEFSEGGRWARSAYTCSKAGGAPVVMEPSTLIEPLIQGTEGVFCPTVMEPHTGRFEYENVLTGDVLSFERNGRWCVGSDCSAPLGGGTPVGAVMATHQVVNVSDFDGHFEAKGVPKMEAQGGGDLAKQLKKLKPPKRPAQPKKPSLQRFKATMPQYAEECLNYQDLWKKITETHVNEEKEEVVEDAKLEADPGTEGQELEDYHPCAVAAGAGGIFGRLGGGDGKLAPENILYKDWNDCMQGDINRALLGAKVDFAHAIFDLITGPVHEGIELVCNVIPDVEIAPLGAGIQIEPKSICEELADFIDEMSDLPVDFAHETFNYKLEEEGFNACNPFQVGFARIFCDIHCVRDAVIRGDRTILKNLEKATKISNENMQKMVEWSTEANRVETEYLDKKIDHSLKVTTIYLEHIAQNTAPALLKNTAAETQAMMKELRGYAEAASFSTDGLRRAQGALDDFVASAKLENSNGTERLRAAELFHSKVQQLHDSLLASSGGLKHAQVVGRQVASEVQQLERRLLVQERALGRYRRQQSMAKGSQRSENEALMALDHLWWRMRKHLEGYLEVADAELEQFQASLSLLDSYDRCFASKEELLRSYGLSMKMMRKSHRKLKSSWRELSNLMGEVSASIADGGYFESFVAMEGCGSELAKQTLQQARSAVQGMMFLFERFQAASLSPPDVSTLKQSTKRIRKAYTEATKQCKV